MTKHQKANNFKPDVALPMETREAPITQVNEEDRTIEVTWITGAGFKRFDYVYGETYIEELEVSEKAVRLNRLNSGGPVLDNHKVYSGVAAMLAVVDRAWIEGGEGRATIRFPKAEDDPEADKIFRKIKDKIITRLSCGYKRLKIEVDKSQTPKVWRVVDWEPFEISFVTVPADVNAKVRSSESETFRCQFFDMENRFHSNASVRMRMASRRVLNS